MTSFTALEYISIFLLSVGLFYVSRSLFSAIYIFAVGPLVYGVDFKSRGKWALITGATDGIGKEYARQLAAKGCDIILVSRSIDKLRATAEEIEKEFQVETKVVQADFSRDDIYDGIATAISGLEIGTLVNNVGVSYDYPEYFLEIPNWETKFKTIISANIVSMTRMTALVMPDMVKRENGIVINVASGTAIIPSPLLAIYGASKEYIRKLSDTLRMEYTSKGIIFQCVNPGYVVSNMSGIKRDSLMTPTAKKFVQSALNLVGTIDDTAGYFPHYILFNTLCFAWDLIGTLPEKITLRSMLSVRSRYMKKYKKQ